MTGDFLDQVDKQASNADRGFRNFGKLDITVAEYVHWVDGHPNVIDADEYAKLPGNQTKIKILFSINIQEFRPDKDWTYERIIQPGDEDWRKTVKPSLVAILGKQSMIEGAYSGTLGGLRGKYVEIEDVPQLKKGVPDEEFNTIKFLQIFPDRNACFAAFEEYQAELAGGASVSTDVSTDATIAPMAPATQTVAPATPTPIAPAGVPEGWEAPGWNQALPDIFKRLDEGQTSAEVAEAYGIEERFVNMAKASRS